ncbi:hypothetical protein [Limosilactobacillus gastricus]|uniref:hypothetical protein n=1 Tax=Limosilactobacillus gastricus TaxID=227942 RepID=UPI0026EEAD7B|nr:hypothetical protein [Limosilactobacillus gastricus]
MSFLYVIIITLILILVIYQIIHRTLVKRHDQQQQVAAQQITDQVVMAVLADHLASDHYDHQSSIVAEVWGNGVQAFEYQIYFDLCDEQELRWLSHQNLSQAIEKNASQEQIAGFNAQSAPFVVTDWWVYQQKLHFDVAYVSNEATREYVEDLSKLNQKAN